MTKLPPPEVANSMLNMLRDARALVYRDAESFGEAVSVLEHLGQMLAGEMRHGFGKYEAEILGLAGQAPGIEARELRELFNTVKEARNDSVHSGDFIRHHVLRLVELLLILEEALSMNGRIASDMMVRNPLTAEPWHIVASVRRSMLINAFSYIPIRVDGEWKLISDTAIVSYLNGYSKKENQSRLGAKIDEAIRTHGLCWITAICKPPDTPINDLKAAITHLPILLVDTQENLVGIVTAFDLL